MLRFSSFSKRPAGFFRLFFFLLSLNGNAQVYTGTIDKYPIVFEVLPDESGSFNARYFYKSSKKDIYLKRGEGFRHQYISEKNNDGSVEYFMLKENGDQLNGGWMITAKGFMGRDLILQEPHVVATAIKAGPLFRFRVS